MKKLFLLIFALLCLTGCGRTAEPCDIAATTGPVCQFARAITGGTGLTVTQVVTDQVSCLHDYALSVRQMETLERSRVVVLSGGGLEEFMEDALSSAQTVIDCSRGIQLLEGEEEGHEGHDHGHDPHYWLDPRLAAQMAANLADGLGAQYPQFADSFAANLELLLKKLEELDQYGRNALSGLSCRRLVTFHDGFAYLAEAYDLDILAAMEEEAGSEVSARDLTALVHLVEDNGLPAVFTEKNGSPSAASVLHAETGVAVFPLDMAMNGDYFEAMTHNFDTLKEALQ